MSSFSGLFIGIWSLWSGSLGELPYWNPYGAIAVPIVMVVVLGALGWLAFRGERRG